MATILLSATGLLIGLLSVLLSDKHFALGVWQQSEPVIIATHFGASLCWAGLAVGWRREPSLASMLRSPLVLPALALAVWSALAASLAEFPGLALLGAPQSGEGPLWYLDLAAFVMAAWRLRDENTRIHDVLVLIGGLVILGVGVCNLSRTVTWLPFRTGIGFFGFAEFLGYSALALLPVAWNARERGNRFWSVIAAVGILGVLMSRNRTAMAGFVVIAVFLMPLRLTIPAWLIRYRMALVIAVISIVSLAPYVLLNHVTWFHGTFSLWSRSILHSVIAPHVFDSLKTAFFGHGWGHFTEYLARHVADTGISLVDGKWKDLYRDEFHSHNAALEAAFATGLPGLTLAIILRAGIALGAAPQAGRMAFGFALALALTDATWFMLPLSLAPLGFALAALAPVRTEWRNTAAGRQGSLMVAVGGGAVTLAATLVLFNNAVMTGRLEACLSPQPAIVDCGHVQVPTDPRGQNFDLAVSISNSLTASQRRSTTLELSPEHAEFLSRLIREGAERTKSNGSALLPIVIANAVGQSAFPSPTIPWLSMTPELDAMWREEIIRLIEIAPNRMDIAAIYLNWLIAEGRDGPDDTLLPKLEQLQPSHPVVLWFRGVRLIADPSSAHQANGLNMLHRAIALGAGRFVPIADDVTKSLAH
ncbi:hypothetical protein H261_03683 [Paramagnetospirillum caucaseum]|uniref:Lipid A core-O-antigen ligase n=2 Tax=Paramagnetospirillum caucaseum TaxID=1244869 RepID=M2ZV41_9PROT|nr:hypothetical protein H261_03683 [Paramagnetospirillum caucaseum]